MKEDENNQINLIDELKINNTKTELKDISKEIIYDNGDQYIEDIQNELKHVQGIIYYNEKNNEQRLKYEGTWKNDKQKGKRQLYYKNGNKYEGVLKMIYLMEKEYNIIMIMKNMIVNGKII